MDKKKQTPDASRSRRIFDKRSEKYNDLEWVFDARFADKIKKILNPASFETALDLGAGPGAVSFFLRPYVSRIAALDVSFEMIKKSRPFFKGVPNVDFVIADGVKTCFGDGAFDVVVCRNALHHFPDIIQGLGEIRRVLKKEGRFILIEPVAPGQKGKTLWRALFEIRDKGRHPVFYFTHEELIAFVERHSGFLARADTRHTMALSMDNWLNTGCLSGVDQERIWRLFEKSPPGRRKALGAKKIQGRWFWDHTWSLLSFSGPMRAETG